MLFLISFPVSQWKDDIGGRALIGFFFVGLFSSVLAERPVWAILEVSVFLGLFLFSYFVASLNSVEIDFFEKCMAVFSILLAVKVSVGLLVISSTGGEISVLSSAFSNHRHFAEFLVGVFVFSAFYLSGSNKTIIFSGYLLAMCWIVILLGGGRASFLALTSSLLLFILHDDVGRKKNTMLVIVSLILGLFVYIFVVGVVDAVSGGGGVALARGTSSGRFDLWLHGFDLWRTSPFFGVGPMHYAYHSPGLNAHPHSFVVQFLSEWGIIGLGAIICFFASAIFSIQSHIEYAMPATVRALCCLCGLLISSLFGGVFVVPATELLFFSILGVVLAGTSSAFKACKGLRMVTFSTAVVMASCVALVWGERVADVKRGSAVDAPRFWQNGGIILNSDAKSEK